MREDRRATAVGAQYWTGVLARPLVRAKPGRLGMTDTTTLPQQEHALPLPAAANRIARCRFCSTLNEYVEGEPAPLCTNCSLDLSVPSHLRPLDVGVLLTQLAHEPGPASSVNRGAHPVPHEPPSLLEQFLADAEEGSQDNVPEVDNGLEMSPPRNMSPVAVAPVDMSRVQAPQPEASVSPAALVDMAELTVAVKVDEGDMDNTVVVSRSAATNCVLVLPDGSQYPLSSDTVVGRRPEESAHVQTLALPDTTRTLSRTHARIWFDGTSWCVEDLGSVNGVSVLRDDDTEVVLEPGVATPLVSPRFRLGTLDVSLAVATP